MRVVEVDADAVRPLRRDVLRDGRPDADVTFPTDDTGFHLAVLDEEDAVIGVASFFESPTARRPGRSAWQLRGMAVAAGRQGRGVGLAMLDEAVRRLRAMGVDVVWADGRDTAIGFYEKAGWVVEGDGYVTGIGLPHHTVVLDL